MADPVPTVGDAPPEELDALIHDAIVAANEAGWCEAEVAAGSYRAERREQGLVDEARTAKQKLRDAVARLRAERDQAVAQLTHEIGGTSLDEFQKAIDVGDKTTLHCYARQWHHALTDLLAQVVGARQDRERLDEIEKRLLAAGDGWTRMCVEFTSTFFTADVVPDDYKADEGEIIAPTLREAIDQARGAADA